MKALKTLTLGLVMSVALRAGATVPTDTTYHGSLCRPFQTQVALVQFDQNGATTKTSNDNVILTCGTRPDTGALIKSMSITVINNNKTQNIGCTLLGLAADGTASIVETGQSNHTTSNPQTITITPAGPVPVATFMLSCSLPPMPASGPSNSLVSYRLITQ
jgi:hypothetical protein